MFSTCFAYLHTCCPVVISAHAVRLLVRNGGYGCLRFHWSLSGLCSCVEDESRGWVVSSDVSHSGGRLLSGRPNTVQGLGRVIFALENFQLVDRTTELMLLHRMEPGL